MKFLITGGAGFIGSAVIQYLIKGLGGSVQLIWPQLMVGLFILVVVTDLCWVKQRGWDAASKVTSMVTHE